MAGRLCTGARFLGLAAVLLAVGCTSEGTPEIQEDENLVSDTGGDQGGELGQDLPGPSDVAEAVGETVGDTVPETGLDLPLSDVGIDPGTGDAPPPELGPADLPADLADPGTDESFADPTPLDLPADIAPDGPDSTTDALADAPAEAIDIPVQKCCMYDYMCPAGWECVAIPNAMGACKPMPGKDACWSGHDCGPGRTCLGAVPCACDATGEGDGCDIPGRCIDDVSGCCDSDWECPTGQVCAPGGTCQPAPVPGRCWTKADCYGVGQDCVGATSCPCDLDCGIATQPGTCLPLPTSCCNSDEDCPDDTECRFAGLADHMPGRCVAAHLGAACPGDAACCWQDGDCPGGYCDGAQGCGCIDLCPMCGACAADQIGLCRSWDIDVDVTASAGHCEPGESHPAFSTYILPLTWHTSLPAKTQIEQAVNAFTGHEGYMPLDEGYVLEHAWDLRLGSYYFAAAPKVGDVILVRVRASGEAGGKGLSDPVEIPVDAAMADCMFPYDRACSDGTPIICRALPPPCDADKVMAAFQGCQHCVYAATCNCNDGTPQTCPVDETPTCEDGQVMAVQAGCWTCVNPTTCNANSPW